MRTALLALAGAIAFAQDTTESSERPDLDPISGDLRVWRAAKKQVEKIDRTFQVEPTDRIGSDKGAAARLSLRSHVFVLLRGVQAGADQGLSIDGVPPKYALKLYRGSVLVECVEAEVSLETPHAVVSGKMVSFILEVTAQSTRVVVLDGKVTFTNSLGSVEVESGETAAAREKKPPDRKTVANLDRELDWVEASEAPANLVSNPGFEKGLEGWTLDPYKSKPMAREDAGTAHSGAKSARVDLPGGAFEDKFPRCPIRTDLKLKPGGRYFLRAYVRMDDFTLDGKEGEVRLHVWFATDKSPRNFETNAARGSGRWHCLRVVFTAPDVSFGFGLPRFEEKKAYAGTIWIDDIFLTCLDR